MNPDLETSGLATRFQPYSLDGAGLNLANLLSRPGPQSGWLAVWWARLSRFGPWLVGLTAVERRWKSVAAAAPLRPPAGRWRAENLKVTFG